MKKLLLTLLLGLMCLSTFPQAPTTKVGPGRKWRAVAHPILVPPTFTKGVDTWEDTLKHELWGCNTASVWYYIESTANIPGTPGKDGKDGINGTDGLSIMGPQGPKGDKGDPGSGTAVMNFGKIRWVKDWTEYKAALTAANSGQVRAIYFIDNITQTESFTLAQNYSNILLTEGNGFDLIQNCDTGFKRTYASLAAANSGIDCQLRFSNISFKGNGNNIGIYFEASYGSKFEGCRFYNYKTANDLRWCMQTVIDLCFYWENYISVNVDFARFSGGSNSASQSNHTSITNCKFRASPGDYAMIKSNAASGLYVHHNIFEGGDSLHNGCDYAIDIDDNGSTVVKETTITNNHFEFKPKIAMIRIKLKDGIADVDMSVDSVAIADVSGSFSQYDCTFIRFETGAYAKLIVRNIPFITTGSKFESVGNGARWLFMNNTPNLNPYLASRWAGTMPPVASITNMSWSTSGQLYEIWVNGVKK